MHRLDETLSISIVAERAPRFAHGTAERGITHRDAAPHRFEQLAPRDDPFAISNQVEKHVQHLWLHDDLTASAPELERLFVELELAKRYRHRAACSHIGASVFASKNAKFLGAAKPNGRCER